MFFDHFLRISEEDVEQIIDKTEKFNELLDDKNLDEEEIMNRMQDFVMPQGKRRTEIKGKRNNTFNNLRKKANFHLVNKNSWLGVFFLMEFIFSFWATYSFVCVFFFKRERRQLVD